LIKQENKEMVRQALQALNEKDRELLLLRYVEQLSTREIADILGSTEGAIKVRHLRAIRQLRDLLQDDLQGGPA
jgi:RNA polymerase sigma-70 factor (ECF subfamily)